MTEKQFVAASARIPSSEFLKTLSTDIDCADLMLGYPPARFWYMPRTTI
jgi:hypothetical protein